MMEKGKLVLWSLFLFAASTSLIYYLGSPAHYGLLLDDEDRRVLSNICTGGNMCRGLYGIVPVAIEATKRVGGIWWYVVISGIGAALLWWRTRIRHSHKIFVTGARILVLFIVCIWILFEGQSLGKTIDGRSVRQVTEPVTVSDNRGETFKTIEKNYRQLDLMGCLKKDRDKSYIREWCVQGNFVMRVLPSVLVAGVFLWEVLVLGRTVIQVVGMKFDELVSEVMASVGMGITSWIIILWVIAVLGIYKPIVGWILVIGIPIVCFRSSLYWLMKFTKKYEVNIATHVLVFWLVLSVLAMNFLSVVRPFPIGWDDLGRYINYPRQLVENGRFISPLSNFGWEYLTSMGFLLLGVDKPIGAAASLAINWSAGLMAVILIWAWVRYFGGAGRGGIAALIYVLLPMVGYFSFQDMKIENSVMVISILSLFCIFSYFLDDRKNWKWIMLAGVFTGLGLGMKLTLIILMIAIVGLISVIRWKGWGVVAWVFGAVGLLTLVEAIRINDVATKIWGRDIDINRINFSGTMLAISILVWVFLYLRGRKNKGFIELAIFGISFVVMCLPWLTHNNLLVGNRMPGFVVQLPNYERKIIDIYNRVPDSDRKVTLPPELALDPDHPACVGTAEREELERYGGWRSGAGYYATMLWRVVMNSDIAGYYVTTTPAFLWVAVIFGWKYFREKSARWLHWLAIFSGMVLGQWLFISLGIPWYGLPAFLGLVVGVEVLFRESEHKLTRAGIRGLIIIAIIMMISMRLGEREDGKNIILYQAGSTTSENLTLGTFPAYEEIGRTVARRYDQFPNQPYTYVVGTSATYFIPRNLSTIGIEDSWLDTFNCLHQERNNQLTLMRFKVLGFNSIVLDSDLTSIEKDPGGSLHQKYKLISNFIEDKELGLITASDKASGTIFVTLPTD